LELSGLLLLGFAGLFIGAWLSQLILRQSPFLHILIPLVMNMGLGLALIGKGARPETGKAIMIGGTIVSVSLPFILL
jgi:hypothetical protein